MTEVGGRNKHLTPGELERYLDGRMEERERARAEQHLSDCIHCRLELLYLKRFREIDDDEDLLLESQWNYASGELERRRLNLVEILRGGGEAEVPRLGGMGSFFRRNWLAPLAAAAVIILIFLGLEGVREKKSFPGVEVMRGARDRTTVEVVSPSGKIERLPGGFEWKYSGELDSFEVEVFSSTLKNVFRVSGVEGNVLPLNDSLKVLIKPGVLYFWKVTGFRDGEAVTSSSTAWFSIAPAR